MVAMAPGRAQMAMTTPKRAATISSSALRQISKDSPEQKRQRRNRTQTERVWQREAFDYAEKVGELGALLTLQSNIVSLCGFPVRRWDDDEADWVANDPDADDDADEITPLGTLDPAPPPKVPGAPPAPESPKVKQPKQTKPAKAKPKYDDRPANVMRSFVGPDGGAVDLIRRAAYNVFCAGDCTLLGTPHPKDIGILWEFLSVLELYPNPDGAMIRRRGGTGAAEEKLPDDNYTGRLYRSDIAYSDLASSEVKRVLPILQEIVTLTMMVDAIAKSRVPADLLFIPEGMSFAGSHTEAVEAEPGVDVADDSDDTDDLVDDLFDHMTAPFNDPGSAARLVPLVIVGPINEHSGRSGIEVIKLSREFDQFAQELRAEALGRLANALDAPPEAMTGKSSLSHWTAANVDSEFIVKHIQPTGILIADFLTWGYLRPMLEAYEDMTPDEALQFKIEFDPSPVIARADEAKSARDLSDWLSDDAILMANGFTKADMASAEVIRQRRLWQLVSSGGDFAKLLPLLPGFENVNPDMIGTPPAPPAPPPPPPLEAVDAVGNPKALGAKAKLDAANAETKPKPGRGRPAKDDGKEKSTGDETPKAKTKPGQKAEPKALAASAGEVDMAVLVERLAVAGDAAISRALERSGSKVISLSQSKNPMLRDRLRSARKDRVMSLVTGAELTALGQTPKRLLDGAWDDLAIQAREWMRAHLIEQGVDELAADDRSALAAHHLCSQLQDLAEHSMLRSWRAGTNGLRVPHSLINEVLEQAAYAGAL